MTAAGHLATTEAAGPAAVRLHLAAEHRVAVLAHFGVSPLDVPLPAEVHRLLTDERSYFPTEAPA